MSDVRHKSHDWSQLPIFNTVQLRLSWCCKELDSCHHHEHDIAVLFFAKKSQKEEEERTREEG